MHEHFYYRSYTAVYILTQQFWFLLRQDLVEDVVVSLSLELESDT